MPKKITQPKICAICGQQFERQNGYSTRMWEKRKCCDINCAIIYSRKNRNGFKTGHPLYSIEGRFKKGLTPWNKGKKGRESWHNISGLKPGSNKGNHLSEEAKFKIRLARAKQKNLPSGKNHWNWKGGTSELRKRLQATSLYREWRMSVYRRDDFTCQYCFARGGQLNVDHIKPYAVIIAENEIKTVEAAKACVELWDVSNGRTLCAGCHMKTPTYGGNSIQKDKSAKGRL